MLYCNGKILLEGLHQLQTASTTTCAETEECIKVHNLYIQAACFTIQTEETNPGNCGSVLVMQLLQ